MPHGTDGSHFLVLNKYHAHSLIELCLDLAG